MSRRDTLAFQIRFSHYILAPGHLDAMAP